MPMNLRTAGTLAALLLTCCGLAGAAPSAPVEGTVSKVIDGDTLWFVVPGKAPLVVRLRDIDAPEICQPWGEQAKRALAEMALDKAVTLRSVARDVHGRTLGSVSVDGVDVGPLMVAEGHAWSTRTRHDLGPLVKQERMAKALGRGLHAAGGALPPRDFRQAHGECRQGEALPAPTAQANPPAAVRQADFTCDGRTRCTQMKSCAEAKYFLAHCAGVQMDGNRDGVPCERQWCGQGR
jgi:micrococcal nuclease